MENLTFLQTIIAQAKDLINQFALTRMTTNTYLDVEATIEDMRAYGDGTLGAYATRTLFKHRKHSFI